MPWLCQYFDMWERRINLPGGARVDISHERDELYERIAQIIEAARGQVARTVNTA